MGSNLGNRNLNLLKACSGLEKLSRIVLRSPIYASKAWNAPGPDYLNQVLGLHTNLNSRKLLQLLLNVEIFLGRVRKEKNEPRLIDIDLLYHGQEIIQENTLELPHPRIPERIFVLRPMTDIAPNFKHPILGKTQKELLESCNSYQHIAVHTET
ncbi:MAG: 2-amino-4-hydroxy-6-hydroxymethyldihydropteridine diphosphokinase [Cytophagales bacterium]|nr:2-amino-4-hydroxy-6-hydroxymethyldihydropteridine diphosphokinase [Cytophagales bacterium]